MPAPTLNDFRLQGERLYFLGELVATFPETVRPVLRDTAIALLLGPRGPATLQVDCPECGCKVDATID